MTKDILLGHAGRLKRGFTLKKPHAWKPQKARRRRAPQTPVFDNAVEMLGQGMRMKHVLGQCRAHVQALDDPSSGSDLAAQHLAARGGKSLSNAERDFQRMIKVEFGDEVLDVYT